MKQREKGSSLVFQLRWPFILIPTGLWCSPKPRYPFTSIRGKAQSYWAVFLFALYPKREQPWISRQPSLLWSLFPVSPGKHLHLLGSTLLPGADHLVPTLRSLKSAGIEWYLSSPLQHSFGLFTYTPAVSKCWRVGGEQNDTLKCWENNAID